MSTAWKTRTLQHRPKWVAKVKRAVRLREKGLTFAQVARLTGYASRGACWQAIERYMATETTLHRDDLRRYRDS